MEYGLGHFGDKRLQKGGRFCIAVWLSRAEAGFRCACLGVDGLVRFGSADFCATGK